MHDVYISYSLIECNQISAHDSSCGTCRYVMNLILADIKYESSDGLGIQHQQRGGKEAERNLTGER
jgi:hypothetical protein